jgi:uroporphyrinogen decarboxylase
LIEGQTREGFATVKSFLYREPLAFEKLLSRIAQATIGYLQAQISAGAAAVQLFDTWCGELSREDYERYALPAVKKIIAALAGEVPVIYYSKASSHLIAAIARSGADVLSVDWRIQLAELRKFIGPKMSLQGNLDPAILFGPPEKIRGATQELAHSLGGRGHILNLGHGILQHTPVENAQLFIETGQKVAFAEPAPPVVMRAEARP